MAGGMGDEYFLKIDGIQGESVDPKHKDEIELTSFGWGLTQAGSAHGGGGGGGGKAQFQDFSFTMRVNEASPQLFLATASGKHLKDATLRVRRAGKDQFEYLMIRFADVVVTSYQQAGSEEPPRDAVSFAFDRIELEYRELTPKGTPSASFTAGWDLLRNQAI